MFCYSKPFNPLCYHFRRWLYWVTGNSLCSGMSPGMSSFKILAGHQDLENSEHLTGRFNYLQYVANVPRSYIHYMPL